MSIKLANKEIGQIFFVNSSGVKKEIIAASYGSTFVYTKKFDRTFDEYSTFTVPAGVKKIYVDCVGAQGNGGANGGQVLCLLNVTPGETLWLFVGKSANLYNASHISKGSDTFEGRVVVAGGGGHGSLAGVGGGLTGGQGSTTGYNSGGGGGTQSAGGVGSYQTGGTYRGGGPGQDGTLGYGGTGWTTGGAGYYGGGGGSLFDIEKIGMCYGGSGGGSSYTHPSLCDKNYVIHNPGVRSGNGYIRIANFNFF